MTREYEVVYIFSSALSNEDLESRLERHHKKVLAADGAEITAVEHWGKRQLAYPIDGHVHGNYVVAQFSTGPEALPEFERGLKLDEEVLRYLVVLSEGELPTPPSARYDNDDRGSRPHDYEASAEAVPASEEAEAESDADESEVEAEATAESEATAEVEAESKAPAEAPADDDHPDTVADPVESGPAEED